ncbi:MAG TPA: hypothetical protein VLC92_04160 [Rhodocyclaceae bacterium]|nr:hypothetical protein [Rhodocyclaceae bacterium]
MAFEIETTSYCENGISPRWVWWIRGIASTQRFGLVGTDEYGRGLFLYEHDGDKQPRREVLVAADLFDLPPNCDKTQANETLRLTLASLGWHVGASSKNHQNGSQAPGAIER